MNIFEGVESNVRSYCRTFQDVFNKAKGSILYAESGKSYIDFFAGAGALNYGHNNDYIKKRLVNYLESDGIIHGLDMYTVAKRNFIEKFTKSILEPSNLDYKIQFCGSTGTNAVEAALKLARKVTKRTGIFSFMGGFHGMSLGSLSVTSNSDSRLGAGIPLGGTTFVPYPNTTLKYFDTLEYIEMLVENDHSGIEKPAAIILETVQAEGGINVASIDWLKALSDICMKHQILLICDDIQVGCGRTGDFLSFERAGIVPDMVVLSKSIGGYGLPMSMMLMKSELDIWKPGEHNGTFRGNQLAFIAGQAALELRENENLQDKVKVGETYLKKFLTEEIAVLSDLIEIRGIGMIWGIDVSRFEDTNASKDIVSRCFKNGLIIERAGRNDTVIKLLPPLTTDMDVLIKGCEILKRSMEEYLGKVDRFDSKYEYLVTL